MIDSNPPPMSKHWHDMEYCEATASGGQVAYRTTLGVAFIPAKDAEIFARQLLAAAEQARAQIRENASPKRFATSV